MEVGVYMSYEALKEEKALFRRSVAVPDAFDIKSFVANMKSIFGTNVVVDCIIV